MTSNHHRKAAARRRAARTYTTTAAAGTAHDHGPLPELSLLPGAGGRRPDVALAQALVAAARAGCEECETALLPRALADTVTAWSLTAATMPSGSSTEPEFAERARIEELTEFGELPSEGQAAVLREALASWALAVVRPDGGRRRPEVRVELEGAARALADSEDISLARARQVVERWAVHQGASDAELEAAERVEYDPWFWYATQGGSMIPGFLVDPPDYPVPLEEPAAGCFPLTVASLADPERHAVLSMTCRAAALDAGAEPEPVLVVTPFGWTGTGPGFGLWATAWDAQLHDRGFTYNRISTLATDGWSATVTRLADPSAPCRVRVAHADGYVLLDTEVPLRPDWLVRLGEHPEGVPVLCGPCAGTRVPGAFLIDGQDIEDLLSTGDLAVARMPFTMTGAA